MMKRLHVSAIDVFKDLIWFRGHVDARLAQELYIKCLLKCLDLLQFTSLVSALVFLSHDQYWMVDTGCAISAIVSIMDGKLILELQAKGFCPLDRSIVLLHYSVYLLMTRQYGQAYKTAQDILDDKDLDPKFIVNMHSAIALDPALFDNIEGDGGDHCASLKQYASYIAAKSIKMTRYNNKQKQLVEAGKRIFQSEDLTVKNYLMIALFFMETNHYIFATEYFCLKYIRSGSMNEKQLILISLLLEFLQSSVDQSYQNSPEFNTLAKRLLALTRYHQVHDENDIEEIGLLLSDLAIVYRDCFFGNSNQTKCLSAYRAAKHCTLYHKSHKLSPEEFQRYHRRY